MFNTNDDERIATLVVQGIAAGCALIGLLATNHGSMGPTMEMYIADAWKAGDLMAAEFVRRGKAAEEK